MIRQGKEGETDVFETQIDGETIQWDNGLTYARHIQTQQLLSAQVPVSDKPDEMLRSEEHTSELQSLMRISYAVFCLKKTKIYQQSKQRHSIHAHTHYTQ